MGQHKKQLNKQQKQGHIQKSRKEIRKKQRQRKKAIRNEHFQRKRNFKKENILESIEKNKEMINLYVAPSKKRAKKQNVKTEDRKQALELEMQKQRIKQLQNANLLEDRIIKKLEKQLKLNKNKRKKIPKSFAVDGLDYLLEVCEEENMKQALIMDQNLNEPDSEFEEDFEMIKRNTQKNLLQSSVFKSSEGQGNSLSEKDDNIIDSEFENVSVQSSEIENSEDTVEEMQNFHKRNSSEFTAGNEQNSSSSLESKVQQKVKKEVIKKDLKERNMHLLKSHSDVGNFITDKSNRKNKKVKNDEIKLLAQDVSSERTEVRDSSKDSCIVKYKQKHKKLKLSGMKEMKQNIGDENQIKEQKVKTKKQFDKIEELNGNSELCDEFEKSDYIDKLQLSDTENTDDEEKSDEYWEDIYGRMRDTQGNIVKVQTAKYVPPHIRANAEEESTKKQEQLKRLRRQMKGLLNRLAENNMNSIASEIEQLYMSHSRNDMNETLTELLFESLVAQVLTPERLIMEHTMLVAILHANVGTEVGAHVLQTFVKKFHEHHQLKPEVENKDLDNVVLILSHLYNFKVFSAILMFDILDKLAENFEEKEVELILLILRSIGFSLRKDDPGALKELILRLQKKAGESAHLKHNTRVKFMLEILLAIKNNNMIKIPNYDPSQIEHLKKLMKGVLHKGNYVTELKISLNDLLKADERGRWWVIGSAWTGALPGETNKQGLDQFHNNNTTSEYSHQLLELARKQRMNTDVRRNIFCILMIAEDYLDAFEKLLHLGLKNRQEREIIYVIMHCCLQEKTFNPYYSHLAQKFCDFDRKYQITFQCALWDKFKELQNMSSNQLSNLAKFLVHLVIEKGLSLSLLKVIHFAEVDRVTVRFVRQVLLGLLLHELEENVQEVFQRIAISPKLHIFREGIRLFIHHFLLRNISSLPEKDMKRLQFQAKRADKILSAAESKVMF